MSTILKVSTLKNSLSVYANLGEFDKLLLAVEQLLQRDPNNAEYMLYKLQALEGLGQVTSDISFLQNYIYHRSTDVTGFLLLYRAYIERKDVAGALLSLVYALSVDPEDEECQHLMSTLLTEVNPNLRSVKINLMTTSRIGHLSCEIEPLLREVIGKGEEECLYLFINGGEKTANQYLYTLLKGFAHIVEDTFWYNLYATRPLLLDEEYYAEFPYDNNKMLRGGCPEQIYSQGSINLKRIYNDYPTCLSVPSEDITLAWKLLKPYNLTADDKIVCLHVRDSYYLEQLSPNSDWSHHDFRDADINTYKKSVLALIEKGYKVVRIGNGSNQSLNIDSPYYLDFCLNHDDIHGDFFETFLLSICQFFIGTTSGPMGVAAIFDTPIITINAAPFQHPYSKGRFIPKRLFQNNVEIPITDIVAGKVLSETNSKQIILTLHNQELVDNGYTYLSNNEEEIYQAILEFEGQISDRKLDTKLSPLQQAYIDNMPEDCMFKNNDNVVCNSFLKLNIKDT